MFKIKHGMLPSSVTELFNTSHTNYNLRNADFRGECFNTTKYGKKGIRKTDIALLIDDSCNDCVLCKSYSLFYSFLELLNLRFRDIIRKLFIRTRIY